MLLSIAAVGAGVGLAACGSNSTAVGSVAIPQGDAGDASAADDGGDAALPPDASHPVGVVPMPHDGGPVGVVVMVDASDQ